MFIAPLALIGLSVLGLPILIHSLNRRRAIPIKFPTLEFLQRSVSSRFSPNRVEQKLLLLLRLIALALLILGFAQPDAVISRARKKGTVVLIDRSPSMTVGDREEKAMARARELIAARGGYERIAIASFSSDTAVLCEFTTDTARLNDSLALYKTDLAASNFQNALNASVGLLRDGGASERRVEIISDFQASNFTNSTPITGPAGIAIGINRVGTVATNNSFVRFTGVSKINGKVDLGFDLISDAGNARSVKRVVYPAGVQRLGFQLDQTQDGWMLGSMSTAITDDFPADDKHYFSVPPLRGRVLLVGVDSKEMIYWKSALAAVDTAAESLDERKSLEGAEGLGAYSLIVYEVSNTVSAADLGRLRNYVSEGGVAWIQLRQGLDLSSLNSALSSTDLIGFPAREIVRAEDDRERYLFVADRSAPELRDLADDNSLLRAASHPRFRMKPADGADILLRFSSGDPAWVGSKLGQGRILIWPLTVDPESTAVGATPSFPLMVASVLNLRNVQARSVFSVGEPLSLNWIEPGKALSVTSLSDNKVVDTTADTLIKTPAMIVSSPGLYRVVQQDRAGYIAVNVPESESHPTLADDESLASLFSTNENLTPVDEKEKSPSVAAMRFQRICFALSLLFMFMETWYWLRRRQARVLN